MLAVGAERCASSCSLNKKPEHELSDSDERNTKVNTKYYVDCLFRHAAGQKQQSLAVGGFTF